MEQRGIKHLFSLEKLANLLMIVAVFLALLLQTDVEVFYAYVFGESVRPSFSMSNSIIRVFSPSRFVL